MIKRNLTERCKEKGINLSYMSIWRHGVRSGFLTKNEAGEYGFDEDKFTEWLGEMTKGIPEDCEYISDAVKRSGVKYSYFRYYLDKEGEKVLTDVRGKKYARRKKLESIIENYNRKVAGKEKQDD